MDQFEQLLKRISGQGLVEYGLILALVSVVAISAIGGVGDKVSDTFDNVADMGVYTESEMEGLITEEGFIPVTTAEDLQAIGNGEDRLWGKGSKWEQDSVDNSMGAKFIQIQDIDLKDIGNFEPIGEGSYIDDTKGVDGEVIDTSPSNIRSFSGSFDGGGYKITNLSVDKGSENHAGLFGHARDATFTNVHLVNTSIKGGDNVGGLAGYLSNSTVTDSESSGKVIGSGRRIGGLVGGQGLSVVANSHSTGNVEGDSYSGGLVGSSHTSSINDSYSTVDIEGSGNYIGGLSGHQYIGSVLNSYATGSVTSGGIAVGGLLGSQQGSSTIYNSFSSSNVIGESRVGGLVGQQWDSLTENSFANGSVSGDSRVGGLIGWNYYGSELLNSYSVASVTGNTSVGGLIGAQDNSSSAKNYYDILLSGQSDTGKGVGRTTEEMKQQQTYKDWDFDTVWRMDEGQYPTLK